MKYKSERYPNLAIYCVDSKKIIAKFKNGFLDTSKVDLGGTNKDEKEALEKKLIELIEKNAQETYQTNQGIKNIIVKA